MFDSSREYKMDNIIKAINHSVTYLGELSKVLEDYATASKMIEHAIIVSVFALCSAYSVLTSGLGQLSSSDKSDTFNTGEPSVFADCFRNGQVDSNIRSVGLNFSDRLLCSSGSCRSI